MMFIMSLSKSSFVRRHREWMMSLSGPLLRLWRRTSRSISTAVNSERRCVDSRRRRADSKIPVANGEAGRTMTAAVMTAVLEFRITAMNGTRISAEEPGVL